MHVELILGAAAAAGCASILQSAVGFGAGLFAIPILVWLGLALPEAIAVLLGLVAVHVPYNTYRLRGDIPWRDAFKMSGIRLLGVPLGVVVLARYVGSDVGRAKQAVGAALLLALLMVGRRKPLAVLPGVAAVSWMWVVGLSSGFLVGLVGMGGPPVVLWAMTREYSPRQFRAYLWALVLILLPCSTALLVWAFGTRLLPYVGYGVLTAPMVWLGSQVGLRVAAKWQRPVLLGWAKATLFVIAVTSLVAPLLHAG